jgi:hypothetical protein
MITTRAVAVFCAAVLAAQNPYAYAAQPPQSAGGPQDQSQKLMSPDQMDSLVAPIALYPDPILSQVLVASTYPLEVVEAGRWLTQNSKLQGKALTDAAAKQTWDASVQALVVLPDVLKRLDENVSWTSDLGNAFLAQQQDVMDAVQRLRQKASAAGALQSNQQQTVSTTNENNQPYIVIEPASTQVVYVPQYNPVAVWGPPAYPYPPIYYPPSTGAVVAAGAISFGVGMAVGAIWGGGGGWGGYGWGCNWGRGNNNVVINNNFISSNHFNRVNVGNGNNWVHNPAHRGGVPYNNRNVSDRYQGAGNRPGTRPTAGQTQQRLNQNGLGNRGGMPSQGNANRLSPGNGGGRGAPGQNRPGTGGGGVGMPGQGNANRMGQGAGGRGPGAMGMPSQPMGNANRIAPNPAQGGANRMGNRSMPSASPAGAFGGMNQGGGRTQMNSNRGSASRSMGGGAPRGGGGSRGGGGGGRRR